MSWGDGTEEDATSFGPTAAHTATFSHTYKSAGFYRIAASAVDALGATASREAECVVAVYDAADSAKGSGWFSSPAGALKQDASIAGKATFGECASSWRGWAGCMHAVHPTVEG